jgi:hypothetical protein
MQYTELLKESFKKGDKVYTQVKRNSMVAMYRVVENGVIYYEVFRIRLKKGRKVALKSGLFEVKQGEEYPSPKSFGKLAYCCKNLEVAMGRYDEICLKMGLK